MVAPCAPEEGGDKSRLSLVPSYTPLLTPEGHQLGEGEMLRARVCMSVSMCMSWAGGGQSLVAGVFLSCPPSNFFETGPLPEPWGSSVNVLTSMAQEAS